MINVFKRISVTVIAAIIAVGAFAFAACDTGDGNAQPKSLELENQRTEFMIGDTFEYGEGFTVWAVYGDGSKTDVTAEATITKESTLDMNVAGDYQITVRYGGLITDYRIYVSDFQKILRKIDIDTSNVRTVYNLGDEISFDGIKLNCTYENAQGGLAEEVVTSVKDFDVEIKHSSGKVIAGALTEMGDYTVTVSSGVVKATYDIKVADIDVSTVANALTTAAMFKGEVLSGTERVESSMHGLTSVYDELYYTYEFGDNYTYVKESRSDPVDELHLSLKDDGTLFCVNVQDGKMVANNYSDKDMVDGASFHLWYSSLTLYGVDATVANLYEHALAATNKDFKQSADPEKMEYSFSFSGLEYSSNVNAQDYYETKVTFRLGAKYNIEYAQIVQGYWENNDAFAGGEGYEKTFETDEATGITTPLVDVSKNTTITVNQVAGKREKTNPYSDDELTIKSYDLKYSNKILEEGETIETAMTSGKRSISINIDNIQPATADILHDAMYFSIEGSTSGEVDSSTMLVENGFQAYRTRNRITITFERGGEWTLVLRTKNVVKTVKFKVTGFAPTEMNTAIYNSLSKQFYRETEATTMAGSVLNFRGEVNEYANSEQTAQVTSANAANATIEQVTVGDNPCLAFSASEAGEYTVRINSTVAGAEEIGCELVITVVAAPDMAELLAGKYSTTDAEGSIFDVEFTPENAGGKVNGTVKITKTPLGENTEVPDPTKAQTQILSYEVKEGTYEIEMEAVSGDNLGALIRLDTSTCDLVLEDQYGLCYKLVK